MDYIELNLHAPKNILTQKQLYDLQINAIKNYVAKGDKKREKIESAMQLEVYRSNLILRFKKIFNKKEIPLQTAMIVKTTKFDGFSVENVLLQNQWGGTISGNVYIPEKLSKPAPAILFTSGHYSDARLNVNYVKVCANLCKNGFIVFSFDPIGQGERREFIEKFPHDPVLEHCYLGAKCILTKNHLAHYFLQDSTTALNYLCSREDVDKEKIGATGNSGGGTQLAMLMLSGEKKIKAYAVGTYITDLNSIVDDEIVQDQEQIFYGAVSKGFDYCDILISQYDKSVHLLLAKDDFFSVRGAYRTIEKAKKVYEKANFSSKLTYFCDDCAHSYSENMIVSAVEFFNRELKGEEKKCKPIEKFNYFDIKNFNCGLQIEAGTIFKDLNLLKFNRKEDKEIHLFLRKKVFFNRQNTKLMLKKLEENVLFSHKCIFYSYYSQKNLLNYYSVIIPQNAKNSTLFLFEKGNKAIKQNEALIESHLKKGNVCIILDLSGIGNLEIFNNNPYTQAYATYGEMHKIANFGYMMGDSLVALRAFDIMRFLQTIKELNLSGKMSLCAEGKLIPSALIASRLSKAFSEFIKLNEFFPTYEELIKSKDYSEDNIYSFLMPELLQYCDLKEI